jgi:hypothetical protein
MIPTTFFHAVTLALRRCFTHACVTESRMYTDGNIHVCTSQDWTRGVLAYIDLRTYHMGMTDRGGEVLGASSGTEYWVRAALYVAPSRVHLPWAWMGQVPSSHGRWVGRKVASTTCLLSPGRKYQRGTMMSYAEGKGSLAGTGRSKQPRYGTRY